MDARSIRSAGTQRTFSGRRQPPCADETLHFTSASYDSERYVPLDNAKRNYVEVEFRINARRSCWALRRPEYPALEALALPPDYRVGPGGFFLLR